MNIAEHYTKIESWLEKQDKLKIEVIYKNVTHSNSIYLRNFVNNIYKFNEIKTVFNKRLILGDPLDILKLSDISSIMVAKVLEEENELLNSEDDYYEDGEFDGLYDSAGYASPRLLVIIKEFWSTLDNEKILSIINDSVEDDYDVDLEGGRRYLMRNVENMIFNYITYNSDFTYDIPEDSEYFDMYRFTEFNFNEFDVDLHYQNMQTDIEIQENLMYDMKLNQLIDSVKNNKRFSNRVEILKSLLIKS